MRSRVIASVPSVLLALLVATVVYNVYDNHRFRIVEQVVSLERLPPSFDGFQILQISDLHGRQFGEEQADLLAAVNSLDYDMIALTGDMNGSDTTVGTVADAKAILDLLDGLENKEYVFWLDGNTGPYAIETFSGGRTGELTAIGKILRDNGCRILIYPQAIRRGQEQIWITPAMSEMIFSVYRSGQAELFGGPEQYEVVQRYFTTIYDSFQMLQGNGEVKIMLDHYPQQMDLSADELQALGVIDYDLILAGHYHGGQWRGPLLGALYVPAPTLGIRGSGFFPAQPNVKGLTYSGDVPQYISAGLGVAGHTWWMNFRLFNTPEINLITLAAK